MKALPYVDPIKDLDALIALFGDPVKFAARLAEWQALRDEINKKLSALGEWERLGALQAETDAKLAEARDVRLRADEYFRDKKGEAQKILEETMASQDRIRKELDQHQKTLESDTKALVTEKTTLAMERETLQARAVELEMARKKAETLMSEAERIQRDSEARWQRIEAAAKELA